MTCWKHKFSNSMDAEFWGPSYQCRECGWWHISYRDRRLAWDKILVGGFALLLLALAWNILWPVVKAAIKWNWP